MFEIMLRLDCPCLFIYFFVGCFVAGGIASAAGIVQCYLSQWRSK